MSIDESQYWEAVAKVIRMEMVANDLTQAGLAAKVGVGREAISDYLTGKRNMPFPTYVRIADALGLSPAGLAEMSERRLSAGQ